MADSINPNGTTAIAVNFLPNFYKTDSNKKFLQATIEQLVQPGTVKKINGYIGRPNAKAATGSDVYLSAPTQQRQDYQLEPGFVVQDTLGNTTFFKDYIDYINQLNVFGGNTLNHSRVNAQEFYSWDPHINWDMFVNFQNYYWLPYGPDTITIPGQQQAIVSTYTVTLQTEAADYQYVFTPDGFSPNPVLKLYRGQTYTFDITSSGNPFSFKTVRSTNIADRYVIPGISAYGVTKGTITFTVPLNAPSILYYQSDNDQNVGGVIEIFDITEDTFIDVEKDLLGKQTYTLPNGLALSNGMKVKFSGNVSPTEYAAGEFYVDGVGSSIKLINKNILEIVTSYTKTEAVYFDSVPFDTQPFSDSSGFASTKDYLTINRASRDHNPWSRYNRWFHKDVINASANFNGQIASLDQASRAVRPIIEFNADLKLFNFGTNAITDVDLIDTFTTDVFSTIEGTAGYNVDGTPLSRGQLVLFTADTDRLVNGHIYQVTFINISGYNQIHLVPYAVPSVNQVVLVKQGSKNQGQMYWYNGTSWQLAQQKTAVNQPPLFDIVNSDAVSFGDTSAYPGTTFKGTSIFSYAIGTGTADTELGFPLSYKNISNVGDIVFNFNLLSDTFQYKLENTALSTVNIKTGYLTSQDYAGNPVYQNGWQVCTLSNTQAAIRIYKNSKLTNNFPLDIFDDITNLSDLMVHVYVNGVRLDPSLWAVVDSNVYKKIVLKTAISTTDILTIRAFASQPINSNGYYEIPVNLQNNPLNEDVKNFTLGEVIDHVGSIVDNLTTFNGIYPGPGNLRDLGNITQFGTKFLQHSGPAGLSVYHVTSETNNIVRAIEKNREDYSNFKRNFISVAETLGIDADSATQVDAILNKINSNKPNTFPYYFSDMVPYGASVKTNLTVVDYRIKNYPLTNVFDLTTLSNKAVGIYLNGTQLLYGSQYTFNSQGFVTIDPSVTLNNSDTITTVEYKNTDGCFVPETPTKLGLWPKYEPKIYLDTTFVTPTLMIQGHDGSLTAAYGDYRDGIILELEKRIFNNIKVQYDKSIYDIADVIPSYNRSNVYSRVEFEQTLAPSFYKWASLVNQDFTKPLRYDITNSFTWNYSGHSAPNGTTVPGYWRGIYRYLLDTDRPNICPWEMLGFSIEPSWWTSTYGPAPYTSENLVMWQDIANGLVKGDGTVPAVTLTKYAKPFLTKHIPVDSNGNLISPIASGLAIGTVTLDSDGSFVFGDVGPVESAWRRSSHFPFSIILTSILLTPAKTFGVLLDRSRIVRNLAGQLIYKDTGLRIRPADVVLPSIYSSTTRVSTAGIINYLVNYILSDNLKSYNAYQYDLTNIDARLSYRIGAFTSKEKFNLLLDSRTYAATSSVFVPQEDYSIVLNSSSPIKKITYSGVVITKLNVGYEVKGYSTTQLYFKYYPYTQSGTTINVGGISESFTTWTENQQFAAGTLVKYGNSYYRVKTTHTTTTSFVGSYYTNLSTLPVIGGRTATFRKAWNRNSPITVPYGTVFNTVQDVVDFLLGYGEYLKDQGFIFDEFNSNLNAVTNWETSAKEFMFWTTQNWSAGQDKWTDWIPNTSIPFSSIVRYQGEYYRAVKLIPPSSTFTASNFVKLDGLSSVGSGVISLSPSANKITFKTDLSVVDDITNSFNGYEIFKVDGTPLESVFINSYREDTAVSYSSRTTDGIYGASFFLVQKEQVVILNNSTMFNDTIYNPPTGYRQERIKVSGYVSANWYGGFDVPGFIFDEAIINDWQPWQDYNLGDIVKYKQFYYSADTFVKGTEFFVPSSWVKLNIAPMAELLPNWSYKAGQFTDFYSLDSDNFDSTQQKVAQHLIGYQKRTYLDNIIKDDVSEFKFYQGMIREKGTQNVLNKLFDVLSADNLDSLTFYEEWAIRVGQYGASEAFSTIEFILDETLFKNNPQGFALVNQPNLNAYDFIIRQTPNDVYLKPLGYNSQPWPALLNYQPYLRSAGYVRSSDVFLSLGYLSDIVTYDVTTFKNSAYVWVAFENTSWNIYRYTDVNLQVTGVAYDGASVLTITVKNDVTLSVGSWIGITQTTQINGFYQIASVTLNSFTVSATISGFTTPFPDLSRITISALLSQRTATIDNIDSIIPRKLLSGELLWTDDAGNGQWGVWQYSPIYVKSSLTNTSPAGLLNYGRTIGINFNGTILGISTANGEVITWDKAGPKSPWIQRSVVQVPFIATSAHAPVPSTIATVVSFSTDGTWMATGSPGVGYAYSNYAGEYNTNNTYTQGSIVSVSHSNFYQALQAVPINTAPGTGYVSNVFWESVPYIPVIQTGTTSNLIAQGVISLYKKDANNIYNLVDTIISPNPQSNELFGSSIQFFNQSATSANLLVGASGSGKIYSFVYGTVQEASSAYNPVGSSNATLVLTSTAGILPGMTVSGTGFTSGQTVLSIASATTLILSGSPDSQPSGIIKFSISGWFYNSVYATQFNGSTLGNVIVASGDSQSAYAISALGGTNGVVQVISQSNTYTITGTTATFGTSIALSNDGTYIAVGDPLATGIDVNQGAVVVYKLVNGSYKLYQTIINHAPQNSGSFGKKIAFMSDKTLVIYSSSGDTNRATTFDNNTTTFDKSSTDFVTTNSQSGRIDVYDNYSTKWVYSESLSTTNISSDGYGTGFAVGKNHVIISAPYAIDQGLASGLVYEYSKTANTYTWSVYNTEESNGSKPDITKIKKAFLYDRTTGDLITHLDVVDPLQGKIPGIAAEEITFNAFYDPAVYSVGDSTVTVNSVKPWGKDQVGKLWWDLRTAKFINAYDNDVVYRNSAWNTLAPGASIDIYEWVSTSYLPASWDALADTEQGLASGISGKSLYGNTSYSISQVYDTITQSFRNTYYFWVKNKTIIPNVAGRYISAAETASLIGNPRGQGYQYLAITGLNSFSLVNVKPNLKNTDVVLSVEYWNIKNTKQNVHSHWKIISNDVNTVLPKTIEQKWIDSLCGKDINDRPVPDLTQPIKLRYGIENRPRQSMFINRFEALKQVIEKTNILLANNQIVHSRDLTALNSFDTPPTEITGQYDTTINAETDLVYVSVRAFRRPSLSAQVSTDGKITGITVSYPGAGYLSAPYIEIHGAGQGAIVRATINSLGQIIGATVINAGEGYIANSTIVTVRDYSVLVASDSTVQGAWSIYSYDPTQEVWSRIKSKTYDVRNYWSYIDWYATGYNQYSAPDVFVDTFADLSSINPSIGSLVYVAVGRNSGWELLYKFANSLSVDWTQTYQVVGIQNGTIQFSSTLYSFANTNIGYDDSTFDGTVFDNIGTKELRIILTALKNNILIDEYKQDYLNLFFTTVRYALSEQTYLDWIYKTSFVKAIHNLGGLNQPVNYQTDNISNFQDYIAEVKPYRTKIREYISNYSKVDPAEILITDFDLPPTYLGSKLVPVQTSMINGAVTSDNPVIQTYPWKNWLDNLGFVVTELRLVNGGSGYVTEPTVVISGGAGSGATARAFYSNGVINRLVLLTHGTGYLSAPTVTINGGLSANGVAAKAVAIIGNSYDSTQPHGVIRSNLIKMKLDRITQSYYITDLSQTETFKISAGSQIQFTLTWAPDVRIIFNTVIENGIEVRKPITSVTITNGGKTVEVLRDLYELTVKTDTTLGYTRYYGQLTFKNSSDAPTVGSTVIITYQKDWLLLNAADRIQYYYEPVSGQIGKDISQLMTGIDYGGTIVNGLGFSVAAGWDALPYYQDKWDTFDSTFSDYIVTVTAGQRTFTLPYVPPAGTQLNVYYQQANVNSYTSDGVTLVWPYNYYDSYPTVTVTTTLVADNPSTTVNISGVILLKLTNITGIHIGDTVTSSSSAVAYSTTVTAINTGTKTLTLSQILYGNVVAGQSFIFTRQLNQPVDVDILGNGTIVLTNPITAGSVINIYGTYVPVRIDDPNYVPPTTIDDGGVASTSSIGEIAVDDGTASSTSSSVADGGGANNQVTVFGSTVVMVTPVADGITNPVITIPSDYPSNTGDTFIIRQSTSDGSIRPQESDYDTALTGGDLAYSTASGLLADDIIVDGDGLVTPTTSPAPEEVVPGQVVDAVAIKVYDTPANGSANIKIDNFIADGSTTAYKVSQIPSSPRAIIVKLNSTVKTYGTDYTVDYKNQLVTFNTAPSVNTAVSIFSLGFNGSNILDFDHFVGDGETTEFVTKAPWLTSVTSLVYQDGIAVNPQLFKTDSTYVSANRIGLKFATAPAAGALINYIIVSGSSQTFAVTKTETIVPNGSTTYKLQYPIGNSLPLESSMLVRVDQNILTGPNNSYFTIANNQLGYTIDPNQFLPYSVTINNIVVLANGISLAIGSDYTVDLSGITINISQSTYNAYVGQKLIVSITTNEQYTYNASTGQITFNQAYDNTHTIEVISSYNHDILDIERSDVNVSTNLTLVPDTVQFFKYKSVTGGILQLSRPVITDSYIWVIKNNKLLTPAIDYKLNDDKISITLSSTTLVSDQITLITFSSNVLLPGISYMQFKDMLNRVHFKRLNLNKQTYLKKSLHFNDTTITVADASNFDAPSTVNNRPGIIEIRGERIEFFSLNYDSTNQDWVLGQLRRGTLGTGVPPLHNVGSWVQEIGASETIPYTETTVTEQISSTGSNFINLTFTPTLSKTSWSYASGYVSSIPAGYGQSNDIEVFVGGYDNSVSWTANTNFTAGTIVTNGTYTYTCVTTHTSSSSFNYDFVTKGYWTFFIGNIRLKKQPYKVHNINIAPDSPAGDLQLDADFAVDGVSQGIWLTTPQKIGNTITVVKRTGKAWDSSISILADDSNIAKFLKAAPGVWYKDFKQVSTLVSTGPSLFDSDGTTLDNGNITFDQG